MNEYLSNLDLNQITVRRTSLTRRDAVGVWIMRLSGEKQQTIANRFGTNMGRIADVLTGKKHPGAEAAARKLMIG